MSNVYYGGQANIDSVAVPLFTDKGKYGFVYTKREIYAELHTDLTGIIFTQYEFDGEHQLKKNGTDNTMKVYQFFQNRNTVLIESLGRVFSTGQIEFWNSNIDYVFFAIEELSILCKQNNNDFIVFSGSETNYGKSAFEYTMSNPPDDLVKYPTLKAQIAEMGDSSTQPLVAIGTPCPTMWDSIV